MPDNTAPPPDTKRPTGPVRRLLRFVRRWVLRLVLLFLVVLMAYRWINPPITPYQAAEWLRGGSLSKSWLPLEQMAPEIVLSVMAAEDAKFCGHRGFDFDAIRATIRSGANGGASTISQQVAKNLFLWQGRSWTRKGLEAVITMAIELAWPKRRIIEIYLNVAEFDAQVFGVSAGAQVYFDRTAEDLTARQAARLAMVLPNPKDRSAARITTSQSRRVQSIMDGAATLRKSGAGDCFLRR